MAIQFANDKLKVDKEVVLAAVKQDENAVQYAGDKVRFDKSFMKKLLPKEEIFEKYFMDKENLEYKYSVHISGSGGERKAGEISKKTYEFFANDNDLLTSHVYHDENGGIPEDVQIGPWLTQVVFSSQQVIVLVIVNLNSIEKIKRLKFLWTKIH